MGIARGTAVYRGYALVLRWAKLFVGNLRGTYLYCAFCPYGACVCVRVRMVSRWASAHCVCLPGVLCLSDVLVIENGLW